MMSEEEVEKVQKVLSSLMLNSEASLDDVEQTAYAVANSLRGFKDLIIEATSGGELSKPLIGASQALNGFKREYETLDRLIRQAAKAADPYFKHLDEVNDSGK